MTSWHWSTKTSRVPLAVEIDIGTFNPVALLLLAVPLFSLWRRGRSAGYLLCFSLFFLYLWAALSYTVFPLRLDGDYIDALRQHRRWANNVNLIPLAFLRRGDVRSVQVYGNCLLGVPLGFGFPFIVNSTPGRVARLGLSFAAGLELLQLLIGLLYGFPYRVIDVDDVLLVFSGVIFGHVVLRAVARVYQRLSGATAMNCLLGSHIHSVLLGLR